MRFRNNRLITQGISLVILVAALVIPRSFALGRFVAVDEVNWLHRSATFYDAVVTKNWEGTYVNNSPGVITSWVGAIAFRLVAPDYSITRDAMVTSYTAFENRLANVVKLKPIYLLALSRAIMIALLVSLLVICFFYAQRLFGIMPSLMGFLIIALDPFFIALTRMNHLDAPQAVFMFLSMLAFLTYLCRGKRWFDLFVSGAAGGLAFLSKLPGIIIIPAVGLLSIWDYFKTMSFGKGDHSSLAGKSLWNTVQSLLIWMLVFIVVYVAFWPAMWVQPVDTIKNVFGQSYSYASTIVEEGGSDDEVNPKGLVRRPPSYYLRYPVLYFRRTTPIVMIGIILLIYAYLSKREIFSDEIVHRSILGLLLLAVVYTVGMTFPSKSSEKYLAPVHLIMGFLAGLGWYSFAFILPKVFRLSPRKYSGMVILLVVIIVQSIWVYQSFPYYYTYFNPLMRGVRTASQNKIIGVGEGLDKAGLYLLSKPNSSQLNVMSWYGIGPFSYYFDGDVEPLYIFNSKWTPDFIQNLSEMDYLVVYINQKTRNKPPELMELLEEIEPEHTVSIKGTEYAWIYKVSNIPLPQP